MKPTVTEVSLIEMKFQFANPLHHITSPFSWKEEGKKKAEMRNDPSSTLFTEISRIPNYIKQFH